VGAILTSGIKGARLGRIATTITYYTTPNAPSNTSAFYNATTTNVSVFWTDNSANENWNEVERGTNGISFSQVATTTLTSLTDSGLSSGTYYYRVRAVNDFGSSGYSNVASTTIP
jgi:predicted phage tail protein